MATYLTEAELQKLGAKALFEGSAGNIPMTLKPGFSAYYEGGGVRPLEQIQYQLPGGEIFQYRSPGAGIGYSSSGTFEQISGTPYGAGSTERFNDLIASGQYRDVPASLTQAYASGQLTEAQAVAQLKGTPIFNPTSGPIINQGFGPTPLSQTGFELNASGQGFSTIQSDINQATNLLSQIKIPETITSKDISQSQPIPQFQSSSLAGQEAFFQGTQQAVSTARSSLEAALSRQKQEADKRTTALFDQLRDLTSQADPSKDPNFAQKQRILQNELNAAEAASAQIQKNFEDNQALVNELESLLTEGNAMIEQMKGVTGLQAIRNPRINQAIDAVNARSGVLQAVMSARSGQIAEAHRIINNALDVANAERNERLGYLNSLLELAQSKALALDKNEKELIGAQINLLENDLKQSQTNANYIQKLMTDPDTAGFMARAGITLNDSPAVVNQKMSAEAQRQEISDAKNQLVSEGYTFVPFPSNTSGLVSQVIGGKTLWFKPPATAPTGITGAPGEVPPTTLNGKSLTDTQALTLGYAKRMYDADQIIAEIGDQFTGISSYLGQYLPNILKSEDRQRLEQAQRNFINAALRKESGAAIGADEFDSAAKQYFPQPGDSQAVLEQKAANRQRQIESFQIASNVPLSEITGSSKGGGSYEDYLKAIQ